MSVYVDTQPYKDTPPPLTVSWTTNEAGDTEVLIVPVGMTVLHKGRVYTEGQWTVEK